MPTQDFKGTINGVVPNQIIGDGVAGRVLRCTQILLANGTDAATVKSTTYSIWNGDENAVVDNIVKNATTGIWALNAGGSLLTFLAAGISGDAIAVISALATFNGSGVPLTVYANISGGNIRIYFRNQDTGAALDITTLVDTGVVYVDITYLTSA